MNTIIIDRVKTAYRVEYGFNTAIVTFYVKKRRGQQVIGKGIRFDNYLDYAKGTLSFNTKNYSSIRSAIEDQIKGIEIYICVREADPADKMFIKEIFKALE